MEDFDYGYETQDLKSYLIGSLDLSVCHKYREQLTNVRTRRANTSSLRNKVSCI